MRVLVTGAAGFIGSHTVRALLKDGNEVVGVDDFNDYYDPEIKRKNIAEFLDDARFKIEKADIRNEQEMMRIFKKYTPERVIHLAARAGVRPSIKDPILYHDVNVNGTLNILGAAQSIGVKNFVFASSSSVYGGLEATPFCESAWPLNPISPYAATKLGGENLCRYFHEQFGMSTTCLRFFTVYGPSGRPDMAPYMFTKSILEGTPINRFGKGDTKRDYTFVEDIVSGVVSAIKTPLGYEIINLGNNQPIELNEFIGTIEKVLGKKAKINELSEAEGDVKITYADIEKAKKLLQYNPKTKIEEGMRKFAEWYVGSAHTIGSELVKEEIVQI
ncbi:MAG: NAD-dependent epimerase/dehydratase [Candidatus Peregrinibacteria bacterium GW2011_GWF2_43_17]|nr:MAG: NAD-dependent epimerase/dehydratase [Candidatus Peregrinibacteria bacterium GW2011_GWF2_43_17]KKT19632.1 MAG: NAD-dependent epimerase/dehydratase [Candidatus Peregrinibacteria bacterium GW2011_GWA2_43_8]HAU40075.1 epimerase [Candidatus Peregrinibacteria bacterium]